MKLLAICIVFLFIVYNQILIPGFHVANDLPYSSSQIVAGFFALPAAYSSIDSPFGANKLATLWSYPYNFLYSVLQVAGIGRNLEIILLGILPIWLLVFWGMLRLGDLCGLNKIGRLIAALVYLSNTYILLLIDGGQLLWALSYSAFPAVFYLVEKQIQSNSKQFFIPALSLVGLGFFDVRAVYLIGLLFGIRFLFGLIIERRLWSEWLIFWCKLTGIYLIFFGLFNCYWLLPLILTRSDVVPANFLNLAATDFSGFTTWFHALFLSQPHWYKNQFGQTTSPQFWLFLLPVLAFSAAWFRKKDVHIGFLLLVALLGLFLAKGSNPPYGFIFNLLLTHFPGFVIFRDPTKFFVFIAFSYSLLIGITVTEMMKFDFFRRMPQFLFLSLGMIGTVFISWPLIVGLSTGLLSQVGNQSSYIQLENFIKNTDSGKVLWVPQKATAGYFDAHHLAVNATDLTALRPFADGIKGDYETLNFLREASYSGQLLDIAGVGYLAYSPLNPKLTYKPDQIVYHQLFLQQLKGRDWIDQVVNLEIPILKTKEHQQLFFMPKNTFLVVGSDKIYDQSTKSAGLSLAKNGFIFLDERAGTLAQIPPPLHHFFLNQTSDVDLMMSFLPQEQLIFPAKMLNHSPNETGWWKREGGEFLSFKNFLSDKYGIFFQDFDLGGGWAVGEGVRTLTIPVNGKKGDQIFVRALQSTRSGELKIDVDNQEVSVINLQGPGDNIFWFPGGRLSRDVSSLHISVTGDITVFNALTVLNQEQLQTLLNKEDIYIKGGNVSGVFEGSTEKNPYVQFNKINEDQYRVVVQGVKKPSTLVFAQSYDPKWQLNGQSSFPIYSMFNGFMVDRDGEFLIEYSPHKYLKYGFIVSLTTLLGVGGLLIWKKFKKA